MKPKGKTVFLVQRIGPYHHARLEAWAQARRDEVVAIEFRPEDAVYAWAPVGPSGSYVRFASRTPAELRTLLDRISPAAVVCTGYADPEIRQAVDWALARQVPLITCSDSTREDESRRWFKERVKHLALQPFAAALVAGVRSGDYLRELGVNAECIFRPWDVVDNVHFAAGAAEVRRHSAPVRTALKLPERYFLCVARFVSKKNLEGLVTAYARYARESGGDAWSLVLSGSGPLEPALRRMADTAALRGKVHFVGFLQYPELPAVYALAGALVLPSLSDQWGLVVNEAMAAGLPVLVSARCGCAPDLVCEGLNGFSFDPRNLNALADRMHRIVQLGEAERRAMGHASQQIIADYSPLAFARGIEAAVLHALNHRPRRASWMVRQLNKRLAARPVSVP